MTPQELEAMRRGEDPRAYYQDLVAAAQRGDIPAEALGNRGATPIMPRRSPVDQAKNQATQTLETIKRQSGRVNQFLGGLPTGAIGLGVGLVPSLGTAYSESEAGRPLGAVAALAGGGAGGLAGAAAARLLPTTGRFGLVGKAAQTVLPALGAAFGAPTAASAAESAKASATNQPIKGKEQEFSSQMATARALNELGTTQLRNNLGVYTSAVTDLNKANIEANLYAMQRELPIIEQLERGRVVRAQQMINSQNNAYMQQMVVGAQANLALDAQRERGATMRQVLASNPYMVALQSPNVSIS
jgi:hypothetical protein